MTPASNCTDVRRDRASDPSNRNSRTASWVHTMIRHSLEGIRIRFPGAAKGTQRWTTRWFASLESVSRLPTQTPHSVILNGSPPVVPPNEAVPTTNEDTMNSPSNAVAGPPQERRRRHALLVDSHALSTRIIELFLDEIHDTFGIVASIRRLYGGSVPLKSREEFCQKLAFVPVQVDLAGKNAREFAIIVDAMEILYTNSSIDGFCIVSSRADNLSPLVQHIRRNGKDVIGCGFGGTSQSFAAACENFVFVDDLLEKARLKQKSEENTISTTANKPHKVHREFLDLIHAKIHGEGDNVIHQRRIKDDDRVRHYFKSYGYRNFRQFLEDHPDEFLVNLDEETVTSLRTFQLAEKDLVSLHDLVQAHQNNDGWTHLSHISPDFDISRLGFNKVSKLFKALRTEFEMKSVGGGVYVKRKHNGESQANGAAIKQDTVLTDKLDQVESAKLEEKDAATRQYTEQPNDLDKDPIILVENPKSFPFAQKDLDILFDSVEKNQGKDGWAKLQDVSFLGYVSKLGFKTKSDLVKAMPSYFEMKTVNSGVYVRSLLGGSSQPNTL